MREPTKASVASTRAVTAPRMTTPPTRTREIPLAPSGCLNVHQLELTPDGQHGLAVCEGDHQGPGTLHVVDLAAGTVVKTVTLGLFPDSVGILRRKP